MSRMRSNLKPSLPKSPIRLRSRQVHQSNSSSLQTPPGSLTKSQKATRLWDADCQEPKLRPDFNSISCELRTLAKMVKSEIGDECETRAAATPILSGSVPVFERGRLYEEYSARRNERLKRKKAMEETRGTSYNLGVTHEPTATKRRGTAKKQQLESLKKSVSAAYEETAPRYMLRSMAKENKKPPLPIVSAITTRRGRRI
ncbi:PREDICTED: uncharacterized protein LOC104825425 [Tarenaya hassleriana]|uniref:uncharacterized protein LOC104825425 n=1 Tax=Tarenaya hassleriana TaxID=28532 RepID=UPI00053C9DA4|nr:PREDICTED: uncharacterized protein LOC104825425 [Tarenaya hassleriana]